MVRGEICVRLLNREFLKEGLVVIRAGLWLEWKKRAWSLGSLVIRSALRRLVSVVDVCPFHPYFLITFRPSIFSTIVAV